MILRKVSFFAAVSVALALGADCPAQSTPHISARAAIDRGLSFIQKEAYRWKGEKGCAGCHHAPLAVWAFNEARAQGFPVDEEARKELTEWSVQATIKNVSVPQAPPRDVINLGATYVLLSLETGGAEKDLSIESSVGAVEPSAVTPEAPQARHDAYPAERETLLQYIVGEQEADGSWGLPMDERAPVGGPVEDIAILCRIALLQSGDDSTTVTACLKKADEWLATQPVGSRQARNFRLLMNLREDKPVEEILGAVTAIRAEQNADGGWSQTPEMASDAYATGESLYVLARAGVKPEDSQMARGAEFLTRTQREDGSWPMISRVNSPNMTPITAASAAWAVMGLARAAR